MLAVLSPAKRLDLSPPDQTVTTSTPALMKDTASLMRTTRNLSQTKIRALMSLSQELGKLNYDRFHSFELPFTDDNAAPAAFTFDGEVYRGLSARTLETPDLAWAQDHVAILSGLFGILRPLDLIQPYRLEMGTKLKTRRGANLYKFWGDRLSKLINAQLASHGDGVLVNLASTEYFKAIDKKALKAPVITCIFEDYKTHEAEGTVISFMAKYARGLMARYIIQGRVDRAEGLKDFALERYKHVPGRSTETRWVFSRRFIPVSAKAKQT